MAEVVKKLNMPAILLAGLSFGMLMLYIFLTRQSVPAFVSSLDHGDVLFEDFSSHYYPMARTIWEADTPVEGYYYTAFFALLISPLCHESLSLSNWLWGTLQVGVTLYWVVLPLQRLLKMDTRLKCAYVLVCISAYPCLHNFAWGQVSTILVVLILASFHYYRQGHLIVSGLLLALATSIKYYPAVFVVYFIHKKEWRVCGWMMVGCVLFYAVLPIILMGMGPWITFEKNVLSRIGRAAWVMQSPNSQYFANVLVRWSGLAGHFSREIAGTLKWVGLLIFINHFLMIRAFFVFGQTRQLVLSALFIFLTLPFVMKTSWPHYFCFLPFCQFVLYQTGQELDDHMVWQRVMMKWLAILSASLASLFVFDLFPGFLAYNRMGILLIANLLLLVPMYYIVLNAGVREALVRVDMSAGDYVGN